MTMTDVVVINPSEVRELTIAEWNEAGGGLLPLSIFLGGCFLAGRASGALYYS